MTRPTLSGDHTMVDSSNDLQLNANKLTIAFGTLTIVLAVGTIILGISRLSDLELQLIATPSFTYDSGTDTDAARTFRPDPEPSAVLPDTALMPTSFTPSMLPRNPRSNNRPHAFAGRPHIVQTNGHSQQCSQAQHPHVRDNQTNPGKTGIEPDRNLRSSMAKEVMSIVASPVLEGDPR
ncbi:hypothetical protein LTR56_021736 [Elasticomyces elasticus]|nr:hypothetical protein LTR56_021736 [Elasticomyces elasticus]